MFKFLMRLAKDATWLLLTIAAVVVFVVFEVYRWIHVHLWPIGVWIGWALLWALVILAGLALLDLMIFGLRRAFGRSTPHTLLIRRTRGFAGFVTSDGVKRFGYWCFLRWLHLPLFIHVIIILVVFAESWPAFWYIGWVVFWGLFGYSLLYWGCRIFGYDLWPSFSHPLYAYLRNVPTAFYAWWTWKRLLRHIRLAKPHERLIGAESNQDKRLTRTILARILPTTYGLWFEFDWPDGIGPDDMTKVLPYIQRHFSCTTSRLTSSASGKRGTLRLFRSSVLT